MAFDAFLKIDGIPGESTDDKHKDWIEIVSYGHGVTQQVSETACSAGGASAGRADFNDFTLTKLVDKASPKLFEACCTGKHIKEIVIEVCRSGTDKQKFLEIRMEQVLISRYDHDGGESKDFPTERVTFNSGMLKMTYSQQKRADGTLSGNVSAGWDLTKNKVVA